jgi:hypothetical protein
MRQPAPYAYTQEVGVAVQGLYCLRKAFHLA